MGFTELKNRAVDKTESHIQAALDETFFCFEIIPSRFYGAMYRPIVQYGILPDL